MIDGHARIVDPHTVEAGGRRFSARHILIGTGGWPQVPDIPGKKHAITSNEAFHVERLPRRLVVLGGGYIAVEFASIFNGLGAQTVQLYRGPLFLKEFDQGVREHLRDELRRKGVDLRFDRDIASIDKRGDGTLLAHLKGGGTIEADCVFFATGRRLMTDDLAETVYLGKADIPAEDILWKELLVFFMNTKETSGYLNVIRGIEPPDFDPGLVEDYLDCFQSASARAQVVDELETLYENVADQ